MKLTSSQLNKIKQFSASCVIKNDAWHNHLHIKETVRLAKYLAKKEKADINKCLVSAWLHDIAKHKQSEAIDHGNEGARMAKEFLSTLGFNKKDLEDLHYIIKAHNKGGRKRMIEAEVLWDADKLPAIGASGMLRIYGYHLSKGCSQDEAYRKIFKEQNFFKKRFYTKTAKKLAKESENFAQNFDSHYKKLSNLK